MISIVIPTLNEEFWLPKLLKDLEQQTFREFEIIVVDAHSTDKTREIAKSFGAKVVDGGKISYARNNGVKFAQNEIIIFFDADVRIPKDFLERCYNQFLDKQLDIASAYCVTNGFNLKIKLLYQITNLLKRISQHTALAFATGEFLLVKKNIFKKINGFKEEIVVAEDVDFINRARKIKSKYKVLDLKFIPSSRRIESKGIVRILLASYLAVFTIHYQSNLKIQKLVTKIYGGFGSW